MAKESNSAAVTALLAFMITWSMLYTATVGCYGWVSGTFLEVRENEY